MDRLSHSVLRDWIALIIVLVAVPLSVFGGTNVGCIGQGLDQVCAPQSVLLSPVLLLVVGALAGLITRGWTGLFVVGVGQVAGQVIVVAMSYLAGRPVPIDVFSGMVATIWFGAPIAVGYGLVRTILRLRETLRRPHRVAGTSSSPGSRQD